MQLLELRSVALFGWRTTAACATAISSLATETAEAAKATEATEAAGTTQARAWAAAKQLLETVSMNSLIQCTHRVFRR